MNTKRLLSVVLATLMVIASLSVMSFSAASTDSTYDRYLESIKPENNYGLADTVNEGKILQAWNWSYKNAIDLMETVAEQGFTTIQISPPNEIKMPTKGVAVCPAPVNGIAPNGWWMFYQPAGFQLNESEDNALGTKSEYIEMCEVAHQYGVKIIADAVINHMGTDDDHIGVYDNKSTDPMDHVNPRAAQFEPELLAAKAFHSPWADMTYKENYWDGWSDYEIEYDLTRNCTSGLPDLATETQLVQDTIYDYFVELMEAGTDGFRFDAAKHIETSHDTYVASDFWEDTLLKLRENYPDIECYAYGEILNKCGDGRPFSEYTELMDVTDSSSYWGIKDAVCSSGNSGNSIPYYPNDNFTKENVIQWNESHDTYIDGGTSSLTVMQRNKIWAVSAARQEITGVYFARPSDATGYGRGDIEKICQNITLGDANLTSWTNPEVAAVNRFDNFFGDAPEYNSVDNKVTVIERADEENYGATLVNLAGTSRRVSVASHILIDGTYIDSVTGNVFTVSKNKIEGRIGNTGIACLYYAPGAQASEPTSIWDVEITGESFPENRDYYTIVLSCRWDTANVYVWDDSESAMADWPGISMSFARVNDYGQNQFVAYIPVEYTHFIINDAGDLKTEDLDLTDNCGYWFEGTDNGFWTPEFYSWNPPTPTTPPETTAPTQTTGILGDADGNGKVNVKDATVIQKVAADIEVADFNETLADVDGNEKINVKDATAIQKFAADIETGFDIGKEINL